MIFSRFIADRCPACFDSRKKFFPGERPVLGGIWARAALSALCLGTVLSLSAQEPEAKKNGETPGEDTATATEETAFREIPDRFAQCRDAFGYFWQADANGALTSGETTYLASGLRLAVGESDFAPDEAARLGEPAEDGGPVELVLRESRSGLRIERSLWFDRERGGVRVLDTVRNESGEDLSLPVELRTTYPFAWRNLHGSGGNLLDGGASPSLDERDIGLTVKFADSEGRQDTLLLATSANGDALRPELRLSANRRELVLRYDIELAAGARVSLLHWIAQRRLESAEEAEREWSPFYQQRELVDPGIPPELAESVGNFPSSALPSAEGTPARLVELLELNRLTDRVGMHRRGDALLWISPSNQVAGELNPAASFSVDSRFAGEQRFALAEVAAVRGGGGVGRVPRIYLRDGRVYAGALSVENLSLQVEEEWSVDALQPAELNLLLCALGAEDGTPPEDATHFVKLRTGTVLAVAATPGSTLPLASPWGRMDLEFSEIEELAHLSRPLPKCRVVLPEGTRISAFLPDGDLNLALVGGDEVNLPAPLVERIWRAGATEWTVRETDGFWAAMDEVPEELRPETGFLLRGNNLLAGGLENVELTLREGRSSVPLRGAGIRSIRRLPADPPGGAPFEVELKNGDLLRGDLADEKIAVRAGERAWKVPVEQLVSYWKERG